MNEKEVVALILGSTALGAGIAIKLLYPRFSELQIQNHNKDRIIEFYKTRLRKAYGSMTVQELRTQMKMLDNEEKFFQITKDMF